MLSGWTPQITWPQGSFLDPEIEMELFWDPQSHCDLKLCCTAISLTDLNLKSEEKCNGGKWFSLPSSHCSWLPTQLIIFKLFLSHRGEQPKLQKRKENRKRNISTFLLTEWAGHIPEKGIMDESQTRGRINEMKGRQIPIILLSPLSGICSFGLEIEKTDI